MKKDVSELLSKFKLTKFKKGDLVITAEIHRVVDPDWGRKHGSNGMSVVSVFPKCGACGKSECLHEHIMTTGKAGQQSVMKLIK